MTGNQVELEPRATTGTGATERVGTSVIAGVRALMGVAVAIVGVLAAVNPDSLVLRALHQAMPQLADAIPTLIAACGAVLAAFSQPPKLLRRGGIRS